MTPQQALNKLAQLCSRQEQCEYDLRQKLQKWEIVQSEHEDIIRFLYDNKFLDLQRYTNAYVRDKSGLSKWGPEKIRMMLKQKRIPTEIINLALNEIKSDAQLENCIHILNQKARTIQKDKDDKYKFKTKLIRFAMSRGFKMEQITAALKHIDSVDDTDDELFI
ncbi:MAG: regulatory protein RecX [Marinifilaceae bacterium]